MIVRFEKPTIYVHQYPSPFPCLFGFPSHYIVIDRGVGHRHFSNDIIGKIFDVHCIGYCIKVGIVRQIFVKQCQQVIVSLQVTRFGKIFIFYEVKAP